MISTKLTTSDDSTIHPFIEKLHIPAEHSHKGQNGRVLVIGGSQLFHAASLWAAEIATYMVDMVHYASTLENEQVFLALKTKFHDGIVVSQKDIPSYVSEDDAILIGPGMVRGSIESQSSETKISETIDYKQLLTITNEAEYSARMTEWLLRTFPQKKIVVDAGALQMMDLAWMEHREVPAILTPHRIEFERLLHISLDGKNHDEIAEHVQEQARIHRCVILLKTGVDIVSNGEQTVIISGGNSGLTKGGTGDVLAGLTLGLVAQNDPFVSAVIASFVEKKTADALFLTKGLWFRTSDLILRIPDILRGLVYNG